MYPDYIKLSISLRNNAHPTTEEQTNAILIFHLSLEHTPNFIGIWQLILCLQVV